MVKAALAVTLLLVGLLRPDLARAQVGTTAKAPKAPAATKAPASTNFPEATKAPASTIRAPVGHVGLIQ